MAVASRRNPAAPAGSDPPPPVDREEQLLVRAAWLSYVGGLTQDQIAKRLGLNRIRVNRMLAQARDQGIVQVRINSKIASCVALEEQLRTRYGLDEAIVVPSPPELALVPQTVAVAAGRALSERLRDGMSIGVGWGQTLRYSMKSIAVRPVAGLSVVSLLGGLTGGSVLNAYESASRLAELFSARCYYIAAPIFADTEGTRDLFMAQPILREAFEHARTVDLAFLSVGNLARNTTNFHLGVIGEEDLVSLKRAGAVGDLCAHWIDQHGALVDHPLNRRVIALAPAALRDIGTVVLASGGADKVPVLQGALRLGVVDVLITDERAAEGILRE
ncbi:sugar-binding transcriptional regulator [Labrys wisconsinensis]|uniref:DNA-binding transcriptional regulator LsrR (DeoR family) n=1 Tax=Labrys wisconsinensis TaxID=425677 RepID=A0ABU0JH74_9HYPH|nr:sugar-binding transcriptional regulator [Labrys wisconsinensis]MDQ0472472.1 DNA-binding transcriptional regulator LsrR (DeoR family) [Labrys wisconsinensis]